MHDHFTQPHLSDKCEQLHKCCDELARLNADLIALMNRHRDEVAPIVEENEQLMTRCRQILAEFNTPATV